MIIAHPQNKSKEFFMPLKPIKTEIQNFTPKKQFLVLFDSDGCVIDSMIKKHTLCFGPLMISEWGLEAYKDEIMELWEKVNLYSRTRGLNRFRALALVLKEVNENTTPSSASVIFCTG